MTFIKTEKEIDAIRESCKIVRDTLRYVERHICVGMTTKEVDRLVFDFIKASGAIPSCLGYEGYPASACVSVNEVVVHGIPSDRVLKDGDLVSVDLFKNRIHRFDVFLYTHIRRINDVQQ